MKRICVIGLVLLLCLVGSSSAFDGQRKGFVLGGGIGFSPDAGYEVDINLGSLGNYSVDESGAGLGLNFVIGGAFNERNMLVYEGNVAAWSDNFINANISQGFNGAAFYHYFGPTGKAAFMVVGLGVYVFKAEDYDDNDPGFGVLLGGGYEFSKHWQIGAYFSSGKTSDPFLDYEHSHFNILISGIAF